MSIPIKAEFGRRLRMARDAKRMSRATLAIRLGISPKTIQSWEMGRTFIEKLDLIPALESELDINISAIIAQAVTPGAPAPTFLPHEMGAADAAAPVYAGRKPRPKVGPLNPEFTVLPTAADPATPTDEALEDQWVAVPVLSPQAVLKPVVSLVARDVQAHVLAPASWVPRGGVMIATRMGDSAMSPMIPLGATVIIDRRPQDLEKDLGRVLALAFKGKGLRIRRLMRDMYGKYFGSASFEQARGRLPVRLDKGDELVGRVVGWFTEALP